MGDGNGNGDAEANNSGLEKFPDHIDSPSMRGLGLLPISPGGLNAYGVGLNGGAHLNGDRWLPQRDPSASKGVRWGSLAPSTPIASRGHGRQKSIGDAFRTIKERRGSVSQNAHEIADALRAPISPRLVVRDATCCSTSTFIG
jgi:solute carrier family 35 protein E1